MNFLLILILLIISPILAFIFQKISKAIKIPTMLLFIILGIILAFIGLGVDGNKDPSQLYTTLNSSIGLYASAIGLNVIFILAGFGINIEKVKKSGTVTFLYSTLPIYLSGIIGGLIGYVFYEIILKSAGFDLNLIGILIICSIFAMGSPVLVNPLLLGKKNNAPNGVESILSAGSILDNLTILIPVFLFVGIGLAQVGGNTGIVKLIETVLILYVIVAIVAIYGYLIGRLIIKIFSYLKIDNLLLVIILEILVGVIVLNITGYVIPQFSGFAFIGALGIGTGFNRQITDDLLPMAGQKIAYTFAMFAVPVYFTSAGLQVILTELFNIRLILFVILTLAVLVIIKAYSSKILLKNNGYTEGEQKLAELSQALFGAAAINLSIAFVPAFDALGIPDGARVLLYCGIIAYVIVLPVSAYLGPKIDKELVENK